MDHTQAFPILYVNVGGEMIYIIEQRLQAQNIESNKACKVLNDILSTMLNRKFVAEIFTNSFRLCPQSSLKSLMERIVHASIMRLGQESLDKLFDLMTMSTKFQFFSATDGPSLLKLTLTHVDSWPSITDDPEIILQIQNIRGLLINFYSKLTPWGWMSVRHALLNYLQDRKTRVSVFLKKELQSENGYFHIDLQKPLGPGVSVPRLEGRWGRPSPYGFRFKDEQDAITLGSNIFNEGRKIRRARGLAPFHGLLIKQNPPEDQPDMTDAAATAEAIPLQWETLQLTLTVNQAAKADAVQVPFDDGENLLDLFDKAATTSSP